MVVKRVDWQYALRIRGVTPRTMPMSRVGDYLKAFAQLIGDENAPTFAGIVSGSAVLRASVGPDRSLDTKVRLRAARDRLDEAAARQADQIASMLTQDHVAGQVEDLSGAVVLEFRRPREAFVEREIIVYEAGTLDGTVVGIAGIDDTVHVRLQQLSGAVSSLSVRDLGMARELAQMFRADPIRAHVHGTWKRTTESVWEPHRLHLDRFERLDEEPAGKVLKRLLEAPGNHWATMEDPDGLWRDLRGIE